MCGLFTPQHIEVYDYLSIIDEHENDYTGLVTALVAKWKKENKGPQDIIMSLLISLCQLNMIYKRDTNQDTK